MSNSCVVYRTGGYAQFQWHRTAAMPLADARIALADVARMGYTAYLMDYEVSMSLGLPQTYIVPAGPRLAIFAEDRA